MHQFLGLRASTHGVWVRSCKGNWSHGASADFWHWGTVNMLLQTQMWERASPRLHRLRAASGVEFDLIPPPPTVSITLWVNELASFFWCCCCRLVGFRYLQTLWPALSSGPLICRLLSHSCGFVHVSSQWHTADGTWPARDLKKLGKWRYQLYQERLAVANKLRTSPVVWCTVFFSGLCSGDYNPWSPDLIYFSHNIEKIADANHPDWLCRNSGPFIFQEMEYILAVNEMTYSLKFPTCIYRHSSEMTGSATHREVMCIKADIHKGWYT